MKQKQFNGFDILRDTKSLYAKLGINPADFEHTTDIKKGKPGMSENSLIGFFPKLTLGITIKTGETLKFERNNTTNIYDIDYKVTKGNTTIAWIDNESRANDYPFTHSYAPLNIPCCSFRSNIESWERRPLSKKSEYYLLFPDISFHIARSSDMNKAICAWAKDFFNTEPIIQDTFFGQMLVWQVPRALTCFGKINEHTIENWILEKLLSEETTC